MSGLLFAGLTTDSDPALIKAAESELILIQNVWIASVAIPLFFIIRAQPEHPPSLVAMQDAKKIDFCASLAESMKVKNYVILLIAFFCIDGGFIGFGSVIGTIFG